MTKWYNTRGHPIVSCGQCSAWGHAFSRGLCAACYMIDWKESWPLGVCRLCGHQTRIKDQRCRLCWENARVLAHATGDAKVFAIHMLDEVRHPQLFLANMGKWSQPGSARRSRVQPPHRRRAKLETANAVATDQYFLFHRRNLTPVRRLLVPPNAVAAREVLQRFSETQGWTRASYFRTWRGLQRVLTDHVEGSLITHTELNTALAPLQISVTRTASILRELGIYHDDRPPVFPSWLETRLENLAPGIAEEVRRWADILVQGTRRRKPRSTRTVVRYLNILRPALATWSECYGHLREVTRADVAKVMEGTVGDERQLMGVALRSLFSMAKQLGIVFQNPAARLRVGQALRSVIQPMPGERIRQVVAAAVRPADPLIITLTTIHAARHGAIRHALLDNLDLGNRKITLADRTYRLDELTMKALTRWLNHRRTTWPNTANPHLLINSHTAVTVAPVGSNWLTKAFDGLEVTLDQLRMDRHLEEAVTHRADPLHLAAVFGMDETTAMRYATSAQQLLAARIEDDTLGSA